MKQLRINKPSYCRSSEPKVALEAKNHVSTPHSRYALAGCPLPGPIPISAPVKGYRCRLSTAVTWLWCRRPEALQGRNPWGEDRGFESMGI
jgi:hypothetical protein